MTEDQKNRPAPQAPGVPKAAGFGAGQPASDGNSGLMPPVSAEIAENASAWLTEALDGKLGWVEFAEKILHQSLQSQSGVMADNDRLRRCGFPEVIFGQSKTTAAIIEAGRRLLQTTSEVLVTRVPASVAAEVAIHFEYSFHHSLAQTLRLAKRPIDPGCAECGGQARGDDGKQSTSEAMAGLQDEQTKKPWSPLVGILAAGTTDLPIAEEAAQTLAWMGIPCFKLIDCGVAGPYRLISRLELVRRADVIVAVAGMEGALASVVGGLVSVPVIAVPTSIGYGANLAGITTMLSMLTSCAAGVTTVNIDGGFKGGYIAGLMCHRMLENINRVMAEQDKSAG